MCPADLEQLSKRDLFDELESTKVDLHLARIKNDPSEERRLEIQVSYLQRAIEIKLTDGRR